MSWKNKSSVHCHALSRQRRWHRATSRMHECVSYVKRGPNVSCICPVDISVPVRIVDIRIASSNARCVDRIYWKELMFIMIDASGWMLSLQQNITLKLTTSIHLLNSVINSSNILLLQRCKFLLFPSFFFQVIYPCL